MKKIGIIGVVGIDANSLMLNIPKTDIADSLVYLQNENAQQHLDILKTIEDYEIGGLTKKQKNQILQPIRIGEKVGRNDKCPCGSGNKYKKCCLHTGGGR